VRGRTSTSTKQSKARSRSQIHLQFQCVCMLSLISWHVPSQTNFYIVVVTNNHEGQQQQILLLAICNTPCYDSPNLSLITITNSLVMHYMPQLINSEFSQRDFWFNLNLNCQIRTNSFLVWTSNSYPWIGLDTRCKQHPLFQISSKFKVPKRNYSKFS
jgi:hypothetical protein